MAIGRELLREPQWVEKVQKNDEASIRTTISQADFNELAIPKVMQTYLEESFYQVMHFATAVEETIDYRNQAAPMEGFEKKL